MALRVCGLIYLESELYLGLATWARAHSLKRMGEAVVLQPGSAASAQFSFVS